MSLQAIILNLTIGLSAGLMTYLTASGMSLIVAGMGTMNFGQGAFYILGAFICYYATKSGIPFGLSLVIGLVVPGLVGALLEYLMRPVYGKNMTFSLLITMGFSYILCDSMVALFGYQVRATPLPQFLKGTIKVEALSLSFPIYYLFAIGISLLIAICLWVMMNKTKLGMYFRAIISDRKMVENLGINVNLLYTVMFIIGTGLGGLAGALNAPIQGISPKAGLTIFASVMPALQIGGMGNMKGCLPASALLGIITGISAMIIPTYYNCVASAVMVVILFFRPHGLFAGKMEG